MKTLADLAREIRLQLLFMPGMDGDSQNGWRCFFSPSNASIIPRDNQSNRLYAVGAGPTLQAAAEDYVNKIRGNTFEIEPIPTHRYLVNVPDDLTA